MIVIRTIKTAIAVFIAIYLAHRLNLELYTFAGIAAILAIHATRKESIKVTGKLFASAQISLLIGYFLFSLLDVHFYVIGLALLIIIPVLFLAKLEQGIVMSSVVIIHLYSAETVNVAFYLNEVLLLTVGMGVALLVNLIYMPNRSKELSAIREELDKQYSSLFHHLSNHLRQENYVWDGAEFLTIAQLIKKGKETALFDIENYVSRKELEQYHYFEVQENRFQYIERILTLVSRVDQVLVQGVMLSNMFARLSEILKENKKGDLPVLYGDIRLLRKEYEEMELPATRKEFEIRAALLMILNELEGFVLGNARDAL